MSEIDRKRVMEGIAEQVLLVGLRETGLDARLVPGSGVQVFEGGFDTSGIIRLRVNDVWRSYQEDQFIFSYRLGSLRQNTPRGPELEVSEFGKWGLGTARVDFDLWGTVGWRERFVHKLRAVLGIKNDPRKVGAALVKQGRMKV